jgi:SagB-type dehydrogenase family enzyme
VATKHSRLAARRTWRRFAERPVPRGDFATLLQTSFGVQAWMQGRIGGPYAMKTSPSGGACHPLDAYVVVQRVPGIRPGVFAYDPDGHRLIRLGRGGAPDLRRWFPGQARNRPLRRCALVARFARVVEATHTAYASDARRGPCCRHLPQCDAPRPGAMHQQA